MDSMISRPTQADTGLRAIQTEYRGYKFRSRLEARWAVFFDALGLSWEYEPEGFDLDGTWYLPDFRVKTPQGETIWYEVKPRGAAADAKLSLFTALLGKDCEGVRAGLLSGDPVDMLIMADICPRCSWIAPKLCTGTYSDEMHFYCFHCDVETPAGAGDDEPGFLAKTVRPHKGDVTVDPKDYADIRVHVALAARKARQARFEHGAKG